MACGCEHRLIKANKDFDLLMIPNAGRTRIIMSSCSNLRDS